MTKCHNQWQESQERKKHWNKREDNKSIFFPPRWHLCNNNSEKLSGVSKGHTHTHILSHTHTTLSTHHSPLFIVTLFLWNSLFISQPMRQQNTNSVSKVFGKERGLAKTHFNWICFSLWIDVVTMSSVSPWPGTKSFLSPLQTTWPCGNDDATSNRS